MKKLNYIWETWIAPLSVLIAAILLTVLIVNRINEKDKNDTIIQIVKETKNLIVSDSSEALNKQNFEAFVYSLPFEFPEIIIKNAYFETGHLTSDICLNYNNCFGMKFPKIRYTLANGNYYGWATYESWKLSVIDRLIWDKIYNNTSDFDKYILTLNKKYANEKIDGNYYNRIRKVILK